MTLRPLRIRSIETPFAREALSRVASVSALLFPLCLLAACGSGNGGAGFSGDGGAGSDATVDGSGSHGMDGGLHFYNDSGGDGSSHGCTGLACQVKSCGGGGDTTISGYVYAPNGKLPLYDVQVFIPNAALDPLPKGIQCDQCGAPVSGSPITTGLSDPTGHFTLKGVPSGANIPIVVQLGKWRRETSIPNINECTENTLTDPNLTRLPATQSEGNMPHIALTTGECDSMGCMLPKVGIDPSEFGYQTDGYSKAVNTYAGSSLFGGSGLPLATPAANLWGSQTLIDQYDIGIFSCECTEPPEAPYGSPLIPIVTQYLNAGGRIFTTDFMYTWYKFSTDPNLGGGSPSSPTTGIGEIAGGAPPEDGPVTLVTSFPKGSALAQWMKFVFSGVPLPSGVTYASDMYAQMGEVLPDELYGNIQSLNATKTVDWADALSAPHVFTVDTPAGSPTAKQCGRGVHIDAHVDDDAADQVTCDGTTCYPATCSTTLKPDEAMFAFFFFDLSSCIQNEKEPPEPPPLPK
jgi:hypothetical protein